MAEATVSVSSAAPKLRRVLGLWDLMLYGIVVIQPTAPMPVFGVVSERARGRGNAIPKKFFGAIEPKRQTPRNNVVFSGVLALAGALTITYARGVDLLNFSALIAFMGVNAASLVHYFVRSPNRGWKDFVPPVLGFLVCLLLWWNLNPTAKIAGSIWMALGVAYGAYRTRGFRSELVNFDIPA